jgi:hypothetical protein
VDVNVAVPLLLGLLAVIAAFIRQWWIAVLPLAAVPLFYPGLRDGWQYAAVMVTVLGLLGSVLGVAVGRFLVRIVRH